MIPPLSEGACFNSPLCQPDESIFAIGDVHGLLPQLSQALAHAADLFNERRITRALLLGDMIDRGAHSLECLRLIAEFRKTYPCDLLLGNHEQFMFTALQHPDEHARDLAAYNMFKNGGLWAIGVLPSLGQILADLDLDLDAWLVSAASGNILFVHAGIPGDATPEQRAAFLAKGKLDMPMDKGVSHPHWAWLRTGFLEFDTPWADHFVVHGHTSKEFTGKPLAGRLNLDATRSKKVAGALLSPGEIELFTFGPPA